MTPRTITLRTPTQRQLVASYAMEAPEGTVVEFKPARRSDAQSRRMHAMAGDIAKQVQWCGAWLSKDDWKRICTAMLKKDKFVRDVGPDGQPGNGLIVVASSTRNMGGADLSLMIDWFDWFGAQHGVEWSNEAKEIAQLEAMRR